ncbi:MAG: hypothetical protein N3D77_05470, partial [Geminicoccaceae bacterium]|nr:hypothetical protein [Geminicoccaceae bacterium]
CIRDRFNPHSLICARVLTRNTEAVIDARFLARRLERALALRERLFELLMRRFEAMRPFRDGLRAAGRAVCCDPVLLCGTIANLDRAADWLLEVAEAELRGPAGRIGRRALQLAYVRSFKVWLDDDTADLARTMAELDRRLGELETVARLFGLGRSTRERGAEGTGAGGTGEAPAPA